MIKTYKPTSAGIRFRKTLVRDVDKVRPEKALTMSKKGHSGRSKGRVSIRHRQRGAKNHYRIIDFKRDKFDIEAIVKTIEHDPNRGCDIALLAYLDGEKRYILAPEGLKRGASVVSGKTAPHTIGNSFPLEKIPLGVRVHNVEINPGKGGQLARGAGNSAVIMAKEGSHVNLKLPSGEVKKILGICLATIGVLGNSDRRLTRFGKAGRKRYAGWRPEVRGVVMGANSHPHGGSYSDNGIGMPSPKTPWGKKARGVKTRRRKYTDKYIVTDRRKKR